MLSAVISALGSAERIGVKASARAVNAEMQVSVFRWLIGLIDGYNGGTADLFRPFRLWELPDVAVALVSLKDLTAVFIGDSRVP